MEIRKLTGGKIIGVKTDRLPMSMYANEPAVRFRGPGTWQGNVGTGVLISEASKRQIGEPKPAEAKVVIKEINGEIFVMVGFQPRAAKPEEATKGPDIYKVKYSSKVQAPTIRGLMRLFKDAGVSILPDTWYIMTPELVEDDQLGFAVACNWTKAKTAPIQTTKAEEETPAPTA